MAATATCAEAALDNSTAVSSVQHDDVARTFPFEVQVNNDLTLNLLPFFLLLKLAFLLGMLLKDALVGTLRELIQKDQGDDWSYYSPESYYVHTNHRDQADPDHQTNDGFRYVDENAGTSSNSLLDAGKSVRCRRMARVLNTMVQYLSLSQVGPAVY